MRETSETTRLLLAVVAAEYERQREALLQEARVREKEILSQAHRQAREQLRAAFLEARGSAAERLHQLEARLATARRMQQQRFEADLIASVWTTLPSALESCWHAPNTRARWIERVLLLALAALPAAGWIVTHPPELSSPELDAMRLRLAAALSEQPQLRADASIRVGLLVRAGHNVLDGTMAGLLSDRVWLGSRMLALARRAADE